MKRVFVEKRNKKKRMMKMKRLTADGHCLTLGRWRKEGTLFFSFSFYLKLSLNSLVDVIVFVNRRACSRVCLARPTVSFVLYRPNDSISGRDPVTRLTVCVCLLAVQCTQSSFGALSVIDTDCALHEWPTEQEANKAQLCSVVLCCTSSLKDMK